MEPNGNIENGKERIECPTYEKLRPRQQKFVDFMVRGMPGYKAYKQAVYSGDKKAVEYNTLAACASRLLTKANIRTAIEERCRILAMGREEAIKRMSAFARGTPEMFGKIGYDGQIEIDLSTDEAQANLHLLKKIEQTKTIKEVKRDGETGEIIEVYDLRTKIEMYNAADATAKIMRARGHFGGTLENPGVQVQLTLPEWREEAKRRREEASESMEQFEEEGDDDT